jgi:hypothetical protein
MLMKEINNPHDPPLGIHTVVIIGGEYAVPTPLNYVRKRDGSEREDDEYVYGKGGGFYFYMRELEKLKEKSPIVIEDKWTILIGADVEVEF